ncbi:ATP synthase mitochondrial F1 complex assembly factor 1 [Porphyridium purpureum]|uniref:ATP synthase mitochondrial F1 complex assembly factor 1 n=1 Tax=Porphyridium purpureum TaxID=35688 RepID=A0A5J4YT91_PORPP|nr:ATP synthase mitochondrial F1 complex assembly factor 1 [Porphyridium purpureum]|eukprot:POR5329..scf227_4
MWWTRRVQSLQRVFQTQQYVRGRDVPRHAVRYEHGSRSMSGDVFVPGVSAPSGGKVKGFTLPVAKSLREVVKLPLMEKASAGEIKQIWSEHYKQHQTAMGDVLTPAELDALRANAVKYPMFVYPIKQSDRDGFYTLFAQWQGDHCFMTFLEEYKADPAAAQPWFILSLYPELVKTKMIALMRGEVFLKQMTLNEGKHVMKLARKFYLGDRAHVDLLHQFNRDSKHFSFDELARKC